MGRGEIVGAYFFRRVVVFQNDRDGDGQDQSEEDDCNDGEDDPFALHAPTISVLRFLDVVESLEIGLGFCFVKFAHVVVDCPFIGWEEWGRIATDMCGRWLLNGVSCGCTLFDVGAEHLG